MQSVRKGRRADPSKDEAILDAARRLFTERGYAVSIDEIASKAGVSKQTIYARHECKADLLAEVIKQTAEEMVGPLELPGSTPDDALTKFGRRFVEVAFDPKKIALQRLLISEAVSFPELAQRYYESGPRYVRDRLASYIARASAGGKLSATDPDEAASQFFGLVIGSDHLSALLGAAAAGAGEPRPEKRVERAVKAFMRLYGAD